MWDQISNEFRGKADFQRLNAEQDGQDSAQKFGVTGYPTFIFTDSSNKEIRRVVGPNAGAIVKTIKDLSG